jgi:hypothetical protein
MYKRHGAAPEVGINTASAARTKIRPATIWNMENEIYNHNMDMEFEYEIWNSEKSVLL